MCKYNHKTCAKIDREKQGKVTGTGCIILNNYKKGNVHMPAIYFIKERFGTYKNTYSIIGGGINPGEDCYIKSALRELLEEAKINISLKDFGKFFKDKNDVTRYIWHRNTPLFIGIIKGISRTVLRRYVARDNADPRLPTHYKETLDIDCISLYNAKTPEGITLNLSSYASGVYTKNKKYFLSVLGH